MTQPTVRLSASRIKAMNDCSMQFYMSEILKLPQKVWLKTVAGSIAHSVLEALRRARHREHYDNIRASGTIYSSSSVTRLVRIWKERHKVTDAIMADIDPMVTLVLKSTNFMDEGAVEAFDPEHEFLLTLPGGGIIKGFLDRLALYKDKAVISDYKSQGKRFTASELENNFQALVYMLYVWKQFKLPAETEFILLRHPPTSRMPDKHIQRVPPATPDQLIGFEYYLEHMYTVLRDFGAKDAYSNWHKDEGFCRNVCSYFSRFEYWEITKADGTVRRIWIDPKNPLDSAAPLLYTGETMQKLTNAGCPRYNSQ